MSHVTMVSHLATAIAGITTQTAAIVQPISTKAQVMFPTHGGFLVIFLLLGVVIHGQLHMDRLIRRLEKQSQLHDTRITSMSVEINQTISDNNTFQREGSDLILIKYENLVRRHEIAEKFVIQLSKKVDRSIAQLKEQLSSSTKDLRLRDEIISSFKRDIKDLRDSDKSLTKQFSTLIQNVEISVANQAGLMTKYDTFADSLIELVIKNDNITAISVDLIAKTSKLTTKFNEFKKDSEDEQIRLNKFLLTQRQTEQENQKWMLSTIGTIARNLDIEMQEREAQNSLHVNRTQRHEDILKQRLIATFDAINESILDVSERIEDVNFKVQSGWILNEPPPAYEAAPEPILTI
jgi:hypothetical protein